MNSIDLTHGSILRHLLRLTLPMLIGIISMVAFNLVDLYYVGMLGDRELAALSFTFPVVTVIFSLVQGMGIGATAVVSKSIGSGNLSKAAMEATASLILGVVLAGVFVLIGLSTLDFTFETLGAQTDLIPMIKDYMQVWYIAVMFVVVPFIGNSVMRATGDAKTPGMIMIFAVVVNAILDPIFIFGLGPFPSLGIQGAALATAISRFLTLVLSLYILYAKKNLITLTIKPIKNLFMCWKAVLFIGIPTGLSRMIMPISASIITALLATYGEFAVAAYGIGTRLEFVTASVLIAMSSSISPFTGQNWGAQEYERIKKALKIASISSVIWGIFAASVLYVMAEPMARIFTEDEEVIEIATMFLRLVPISFGFQGIAMIVNANLNTMNRPLTASVLIIVQMLVIYVPLANLGSTLEGIKGIFIALLITYFIGGILSYITSILSLRKIITNNN